MGEKLVDAKAVATLYRSRISGGAIALLVLAMLIAVIVALWVSRSRRRGARLGRRVLEPILAVGPGPGQLGGADAVISLRQHAISLAAVFLALAIGVVLGSGLLSDTLLSGLRDDKHELQNQINGLDRREERTERKAQCGRRIRHADVGRIVHDALAGKSVVMFRTPDADGR